MLYDLLDGSDFYEAVADPKDRSICNVTFHIKDTGTSNLFLEESEKAGLYALKGHRDVGGIRASIYNAMPLEGVQALAEFMREFEKRRA